MGVCFLLKTEQIHRNEKFLLWKQLSSPVKKQISKLSTNMSQALSITFMKAYRIKALLTLLVLSIQISLRAQQIALPRQTDRWHVEHDGSITWNIGDRLPHADHIEMSGEKVSLWIAYSID